MNISKVMYACHDVKDSITSLFYGKGVTKADVGNLVEEMKELIKKIENGYYND